MGQDYNNSGTLLRPPGRKSNATTNLTRGGNRIRLNGNGGGKRGSNNNTIVDKGGVEMFC
eukprot:scaffold43575_cov41-Cyclotella_meneghiniana.AAC.5